MAHIRRQISIGGHRQKKVKHEPRTRMRNKIPQDASVCVVAVLHNFILLPMTSRTPIYQSPRHEERTTLLDSTVLALGKTDSR
jgi:hypothetical protein